MKMCSILLIYTATTGKVLQSCAYYRKIIVLPICTFLVTPCFKYAIVSEKCFFFYLFQIIMQGGSLPRQF